MDDEDDGKLRKPRSPRANFAEQIGAKATRKLKARNDSAQGIWFGFGMMGLIGWSVVVPTLLGAALGVWLDKRVPGKNSWTLTLLLAGMSLGCINAWLWVAKQDQDMHEQEEKDE